MISVNLKSQFCAKTSFSLILIFLVTRDYSPVQEVSLLEEGQGAGAQVTVGWGRKETQFHGSEGKEARSVKFEVFCSDQLLIETSILC